MRTLFAEWSVPKRGSGASSAKDAVRASGSSRKTSAGPSASSRGNATRSGRPGSAAKVSGGVGGSISGTHFVPSVPSGNWISSRKTSQPPHHASSW